MQTIEYSDFLEMVNDETKDYIMGVLKSHLMLKRYTLGVSNDSVSRFLYPYVNSYCNMGAINKSNILKIMANKRVDYDDINKYEGDIAPWINEEDLAAIYSTMDLNIAKYPEEVYAITPEDIIFHQFHKARNIHDCFDFSSAVNTQYFSILEEVNEKKHLKLEDEIEKENFSDLDYDDINYLRATGSIFAYLRDNKDKITIVDPTEDNLNVLATIGGLLKSPTSELKYMHDYIVGNGFDYDKFKKLFNLDFKEEDLSKYDTTMIINYFFDVDDFECFFSDGHCFAEDIKYDRAVLTLVLGKFGMDYFDLEDVYKSHNELKLSEINVSNCISNISKKNNDLFNTIFNVYINILNSGIKVEDVERISILIGMLSSNNEYLQYLSHNNVMIGDVLNELKLDNVDVYKNNDYSGKTLIPLLHYMPNFEFIDFDLLFMNNEFLSDYCKKYGINYDTLKFELSNNKYKPLSREEELNDFKNLIVEPIEGNSIISLSSYGNELNKYNKIITSEMISIPQNISFEELTNTLRKIQGVKKTSIFAKLFNKNEDLTIDNINEVSRLIDSYIDALKSELRGYDSLRQFIIIYLTKLNEYYKNVSEYENQTILELDSLKNDSNLFNPYLAEGKTILNIIRNKKRTYETSSVLMNQELVKILNMIESHFSTIDALTMAKNDILPLIASEMTINRGVQTQKESMMLSQNLIDLFQSLVNKNIEDTKKNLDLLQTSSIPQDVLNKVNLDVTSYIEQVENTNKGISLELKKND